MNSMSGEKLKGIPYTGTLPATLTGTKARYLHKYKIYGNTVQSGTPTPENPIVPSECGERTENLADENQLYPCYLTQDGGYFRLSTSTSRSYILPCTGDTVYTFQVTSITARIGFFSAYPQENDLSMSYTNFSTPDLHTIDKHTLTITSPSTASYVVFFVYNTSIEGTLHIPIEDILATVMVVEDSTAPTSYEPYGYKLPLTSAGQDVDIYLGESQTTRRIKKLVLTGGENWHNSYGQSLFAVQNFLDNAPFIAGISAYSTHFKYNPAQSGIDQATSNGEFALQKSGSNHFTIFFKMTAFTSTDDFKAWLASQYANGTPVTIWYVLATEETGTLNEPLRKIGNYADTIDSTQTTAQIPTLDNSTTISWAGSGLAPSEFDSIQEWVDIPTYTYTNGEWVADN